MESEDSELPGRLLIVEPDFQVRDVLVGAFGGDGVTVTAVRTGEEARRALTDQAIDFVLVELVLPDEDGGPIAEMAHAKGCRVVVTSGHPDGIRRGQELGHTFIQKPFSLRQMRQFVLAELELLQGAARPSNRP